MDKSKMTQTTIENMGDKWRDNALNTDLPRAFINLGTIMPAWHQIASVHDPLPEWAAEADGLYTVWLTDDDAAPLELEASHEVWLDYSDVRPVEGWDDESAKSAADVVAAALNAPAVTDQELPDYQDWCDAMAEAVPTHTPITANIPATGAYMSMDGKNLQITFPPVEGYDWEDVFKAYIGQRVTVSLSFVVGHFADESDLQSLVDSAGQIPPIEVG